jgi:retron-type reverse transcriptase
MVENLDLDLALKRTVHDLKETNFVERPLAVKILDRESEKLKAELQKELDSESGYQPSSAIPFLVPKGGGLVRNARHLTIKDRTVYNACVSALQPEIYRALEWSQGTVDLGYQMTDDHELEGWFEKNPYKYWKQFRVDSLAKLDEYEWLVEADIASYYDNIHVPTLKSDLEELGVNKDITILLSNCLQRWSIFGYSPFYGEGIPQSYNASHILAKLYLNSLDEYLNGRGFDHLRYNDDIRVFCNTVSAARNAIKDIVSYLGYRGLSLQSAKTQIVDTENARDRINSSQKIIEPIKKNLREENKVHVEGGPYDDVFVALPRDEINSKAIRQAVQEHLIDEREEEFDSTVFHFLLNRLDDDMATEYCLSVLRRRPEETKHILRYFKRIGVTAEVTEAITEYVASDLAVYDYQIWQIYEWFLNPRTNHTPNEKLIKLAREFAVSKEVGFFLSNVSKRYIGKYGTNGDLEALTKFYASCQGRDQVAVLFSVKGMARSRRNGFYADASNDGWRHKTAVSFIKSKY